MKLPFTAGLAWVGKSNMPPVSFLLSQIMQQARFNVSSMQSAPFGTSDHATPSTSDHATPSTSIQRKFKILKEDLKTDPIVKSQEMQNRISQLAKVMDCTGTKATELIKRNSHLATSKDVLEKIKLLKSYGFSSDEIFSNPSVLHRSFSILQKRLKLLRELALPSMYLHSLKQSEKAFQLYIQRRRENSEVMKDFASHSSFLAHIFECDEKDIAHMKDDNEFLRSVSPAKMKEKAEVLRKHNIPSKLLKDNLRILIHVSASELDRRLTLLQQEHLLSNPELKLGYVLSCNSLDFSKSLNYWSQKRKSLEGCKDKVEYFCVRLQCDELTAKNFFDSNSVSEIKLKQRLDFLLQELNLEPVFVLKYKELLTFSVKRLRSRWEVLSDAGHSLSTLPTAASLTDSKFAKKFGSAIYIDTFKSSEE